MIVFPTSSLARSNPMIDAIARSMRRGDFLKCWQSWPSWPRPCSWQYRPVRSSTANSTAMGHPAVGGLVAELEVEPGVFEKVRATRLPDRRGLHGVPPKPGHHERVGELRPGHRSRHLSTDPGHLRDAPGILRRGFVHSINDLSVILLQSAPSGVTPVDLPGPGLLDSMRTAGTLKAQLFTAVGYGVQASSRAHHRSPTTAPGAWQACHSLVCPSTGSS